MKIYLGSRELRPEGFKTLDISPEHHPDIVADITHMPQIADDSCSEVAASHVLEHLAWPDSFAALAEMARILRCGGILRLAVPDLRLLAEMLCRGENPFFCVGMAYGNGGNKKIDCHHFGFTADMLLDILTSLGLDDFDWWNSTLPEGANGWSRSGEERIAISLNVKAVKKQEPLLPAEAIRAKLEEFPMREYHAVLAEMLGSTVPRTAINSVKFYQRLHFKLIEAEQRIAYLENELKRFQTAGSGEAHG